MAAPWGSAACRPSSTSPPWRPASSPSRTPSREPPTRPAEIAIGTGLVWWRERNGPRKGQPSSPDTY
eukprot:6182585-Pyramimonas_sp.AAC.1